MFRNYRFNFPNCFYSAASGDMAIFCMIAEKGKLRRIPNVMSVYRKTSVGITDVSDRIINHHQYLISLWKCLQQYFDNKYNPYFSEQIKFHKNQIKKTPKKTTLFAKFICRLKKSLK